jgi:hypothetical protein
MEQTLGPSSLLAQISTLRFPPAALNAAHYREVFNRLSQTGTFNYRITCDGVEIASPATESGEQTKVVLGRDAATLSFDPTSKSAEFAAEELVGMLKEIAGVLPIPVFVHQSHVLRKTIPLQGRTDSRQFIMDEVVHISPERLAGWSRGFASVGLRFIFPPQQMNDLSTHDLKVESFFQDSTKLFVEDTASFLVPMPSGQWDTLKANLTEANRFMDEYTLALLRGTPAPEG